MSEAVPTRQRILNAARELFTHHGYHGTNTRKLAELAGITEGAIFRHFASKREILLCLLQPNVHKHLGVEGTQMPEGSPRKVLNQFTHLRIQQFSTLFPLLKIVLLESEVEPELKATWLQSVLFQVREQLCSCFAHWQATGEIRSEPAPEALARLYMTQLFGSLFLNQISEGAFFSSEDVTTHLERALELFLNYIQIQSLEVV